MVQLALLLCCTCVPYLRVLEKVPEVEKVSPQEVVESELPISIEFSRPMDKSSVENAWRFFEDTIPMDGRFHWESSTQVCFSPQELIPPKDYTLCIEYTARSEEGVPLEKPFTHTFHTTDNLDNLKITNISPNPADILISPQEQFKVEFNKEVQRASFYSAFRLSPHVRGSFTWNESGTTVHFTPLSPLTPKVHYQLQISRDCRDIEGRHLLEAVQRNYEVESAPAAHVHSFCWCGSQDSTCFEPTPHTVYHVPRNSDLSIRLSDSIMRDLLPEIIEIQPDPGFTFEWSSDYREVKLSISAPPPPDTPVRLRIGKDDYYLQWDGEGLQAVSLGGVSFCNDTSVEDPVFTRLYLNDLIDFDSSDHAAMEISFHHSPRASISECELMEALQLYATNNAAGIRLSTLEKVSSAECTSLSGDQPESVFHLSFSINRFAAPGLLYVSIDQNLQDSLGNSLCEDTRMSYNL